MAPEFQAIVHNTQTWLQSSWHIRAPFPWLEACVEWLQEEAGGTGRLSQQQINQQALDQWLLADLRDLDYPILPEGLAQAQKTELIGTFCVQVDSLLDISQPAYSQLQKFRGTDCANDEVSDVTQATQRPWEAKPTRMLLLQVTDGVQSLEAMEYQSIPVLSTALRPGVKLQLHGNMVCRLGVLLLGPSNVKVLGGEVEDLVERNNQGRVMCRTLGLPEVEEEAPPAQQQDNHEMEDLGLEDAELLASLETQEEVQRPYNQTGQDSGYGTLSESSAQSSTIATVRSLVSAASIRNDASAHSGQSGLTQIHRNGSAQGHHRSFGVNSDHLPSGHLNQQEIQTREEEDFPDEDFDTLPMDELDAVIFQDEPADFSHRVTEKPSRATTATTETGQCLQKSLTSSVSRLSSSSSKHTMQKGDRRGWLEAGAPSALADSNFMDEDMDCMLIDVQTGGATALPVQRGPSTTRDNHMKITSISNSGGTLGNDSSRSQNQFSTPALTLSSTPFTYLCLLEQMMLRPDFQTIEIRLKAFIVTLLGKLSSSKNAWNICATISDGTGYLDVELSDEVLRGLLGFSVEEKGVLKRDPSRRGQLEMGMRRCQEELVDMCCIMTLVIQAEGRKATVTKTEAVSEDMLQELEQRAGRK